MPHTQRPDSESRGLAIPARLASGHGCGSGGWIVGKGGGSWVLASPSSGKGRAVGVRGAINVLYGPNAASRSPILTTTCPGLRPLAMPMPLTSGLVGS